MRHAIAFCLLLVCAAARADSAAPEPAAAAFAQLSKLAGHWQATTQAGRTVAVEFRLISSGTALVETWRFGAGRETMTVYHRDGGALVADHYCAQGNVPRLQLAPGGDGQRFDFRGIL